MTSSIYRFSLAALLLLTIFAFASAQDYRGKVQGEITDENGAAVPGAHVVLRNVATGVEVARQTNDDGHYIF
ncbi:MAG TPA: carboxypeptidase-like regulatory domain-containing protein, partial [Pyrinomonadaceae bacterium]|nr:carboxypeptidase-like regulatory domain-containing protein [Pyrinomonadaceae bacterium]